MRECQPVKRVQAASPYDFPAEDGLAFGSPLGGLSHPIDNVYAVERFEAWPAYSEATKVP